MPKGVFFLPLLEKNRKPRARRMILREYAMRSACHLLFSTHEMPTRRRVREIVKFVAGTSLRGDEVDDFLRQYLVTDADGQARLLERDEVGPEKILKVFSGAKEHAKNIDKSTVSEGVGPKWGQSGATRARGTTTETETETNIAPTENPPKPTSTLRKPRTKPEYADLPVRVLPPVDDPKQPSWVVDLRHAISALADTPLVALTADQRFRLAMYHAWRWANCTQDERANRKRASSICAGITNLASTKDFAAMTIAEYTANGEALWIQRGMLPWFKPWDITSQFDPDTALREKVLACRKD